jgi:hypothetical protein
MVLVACRTEVLSLIFVLHAHAYHHSLYRGNVTASYGRPNFSSRLHFGRNQEGEGDHEVHKGNVVALEKNICIILIQK